MVAAEQRLAGVECSDVATVKVGNVPRLGIAGQDNDNDIVQGIVLMRRGAESLPTIKRIEALFDKINHRHSAARRAYRADLRPLRPDQRHHPHRAAQHGGGHGTDLPGAVGVPGQPAQRLIVAATIPFALAFAIMLLLARGEFGEPAVGGRDRLRSGGRCHRHHGGKHLPAPVAATVGTVRHARRRCTAPARSTRLRGKFAVIGNAAIEVNRGIFFSAAIIIAGFVPLFTMSGIEGHIFGPMAAPTRTPSRAG